MSVPTTKQLFDAHYYATGCGRPYARDEQWLSFFGAVAARIVAEIGPTTVLDAGCALGLLVEQLRVRGVEAEGVDISEYAISQAAAAVRPYLRQGSIADPPERHYDLILCIEVLEHMPRAEAEQAVANFCAHSDDVLFSSSPNDYREATHFNVNPPEYWVELFARHGLYQDLEFDAAFITPWATRFRRCTDPPPRIVRAYERRHWALRHERDELRQLALEQRAQLAAAHAAALAQAELIEQRTAALAEGQAYAARLEAALTRKDSHIVALETLLRRIEHGRLMRILRAFRQHKTN